MPIYQPVTPTMQASSISIVDPMQMGSIITAQGTGTGSGALGANLAVYVPFRIDAPCTVYRLWWMRAASASGNHDVGLYDANGTRLASIGATAVPTTPVNTQAVVYGDIPDTLIARGTYYVAFTTSASLSVLRYAVQGALQRGLGLYQQASALPLPATATFAAFTTTTIPAVGMDLRGY